MRVEELVFPRLTGTARLSFVERVAHSGAPVCLFVRRRVKVLDSALGVATHSERKRDYVSHRSGWTGRARTPDHPVNSRGLYHLSYCPVYEPPLSMSFLGDLGLYAVLHRQPKMWLLTVLAGGVPTEVSVLKPLAVTVLRRKDVLYC